MIDRRKRNKKLYEVNPVENIKRSTPCKLQYHMQTNRILSNQRKVTLTGNILSLSQIKQEYHINLIRGKTHSQENQKEDLEY